MKGESSPESKSEINARAIPFARAAKLLKPERPIKVVCPLVASPHPQVHSGGSTLPDPAEELAYQPFPPPPSLRPGQQVDMHVGRVKGDRFRMREVRVVILPVKTLVGSPCRGIPGRLGMP